MKYAVISDIHGNHPALEAVLQDARQNGANAFWFLGDYCMRAPWFNEVCTLLRAMPNARIICGNEEAHMQLPDRGDAQFGITYWTARQLDPGHMQWLNALPARLDFEADGFPIHITHDSSEWLNGQEGTFFPPWRLMVRYPDGPISRERLLSDIRRHLEESDFDPCAPPKGIYLFGHTHCQWHAEWDGRLFINPGSCGISLDNTGPGAAYTLLTLENGKAHVEERRVPLDTEALIAAARRSPLYEACPVWSELIYGEWQTGLDHIIRFLWYCGSYARRTGDKRRPFMADTWNAAYKAWIRDGKPLLQPK